MFTGFFMVIAPTALVMAFTILSGLNWSFLFVFLQCLVQFSFHCGNFGSLGINLILPLLGIVGQMIFSISTIILIIHHCGCCMYCLHVLTPATEHQYQLTPELSETFRARGRQTLSPGHYPAVRVSNSG